MEKDQAREINRSQVAAAFAELWAMDLQANKKYQVPIRELILNSRLVTDAVLSFETNVADVSRGFAILKIEAAGQTLASRNYLVGEMPHREGNVSVITGGIGSHVALEGSGLAGAMMVATNETVAELLKLMKVPSNQRTIYMITDRAKSKTTNDRTGWTGNQVKKLGFIHDEKKAAELGRFLGMNLTAEDLKQTYFKIY